MISFIVPAYNEERLLGTTLLAINAVAQALDEACEVIVVDDGSTDRSAAIARGFGPPVRLIEAPHRGLAAARNRGIAEAAGTWLLHLDADDLLLPDALATLARHRDATPGCDLVSGRFECFLTPGLASDATYRLPEAPQTGHLPGVSLVRADLFRTHGGLDETYPVNADLEWFIRARDQGMHIHPIDDVVMRRRIHGRNMSLLRKAEMAAARLRIVRGALARRTHAAATSAATPAA